MSSSSTIRPATFDEVWERLRPIMTDDGTTQQAILVMDKFGWIEKGPCTCNLKVYGDPCPHHAPEIMECPRNHESLKADGYGECSGCGEDLINPPETKELKKVGSSGLLAAIDAQILIEECRLDAIKRDRSYDYDPLKNLTAQLITRLRFNRENLAANSELSGSKNPLQ